MVIVYYLAGLVSLVCWILVLIQMFKHGHVGLGIVGILCAIVAFVYGWMKAKDWAITNIMLGWTAAIVLQIIFGFVSGAFNGGVQVGR